MKRATANEFIEAALPPAGDHQGGSAAAARRILRREPALAAADVFAAAVAGDAGAIAAFLKGDRSLATKCGGPRGWLPLSYLCFSMLLRDDKSARNRAGFFRCARWLLKAGADANSFYVNAGDGVKESALYGAAGVARDPTITKLLLAAGAKVDDGESLYHAAESKDHACLKLLLRARPAADSVSYCLCHNMDFDDPAGVALFLKHGADPNVLIKQGVFVGRRPLHFAVIRNRSVRVFKLLLKAGADPALVSSDGLSPYALARRLGRAALAIALLKHGSPDVLSVRDQFLAACADGNGADARRLLRLNSSLMSQLTLEDHRLLIAATDSGNFKAVRLMLDLGFPIDVVGDSIDWGGTALHHAAWSGKVAMVKLLLERGARCDILQQWGGDVMATARHGAEHGGHKNGGRIVRLIAARGKIGIGVDH